MIKDNVTKKCSAKNSEKNKIGYSYFLTKCIFVSVNSVFAFTMFNPCMGFCFDMTCISTTARGYQPLTASQE